MIGKLGISGAFAVVCLYTPEIFPTTLRSMSLSVWLLGVAYKQSRKFLQKPAGSGGTCNILLGRSERYYVLLHADVFFHCEISETTNATQNNIHHVSIKKRATFIC